MFQFRNGICGRRRNSLCICCHGYDIKNAPAVAVVLFSNVDMLLYLL